MAKSKLDQKTGLKNWAEAESALAIYRELQGVLDLRRAALAEALRRVEESYAPEIKGYGAEADDLAAELQQFAQARKKAGDFKSQSDGGEGRTRVVAGVEIGYRWGKPYIHIPKKHEAAAIEGLEEIAGDVYVKRSPKIQREVLNADLLSASRNGDAGKKLIARLAELHIMLDQDEEFVLEVVNRQ